MEWKDHDGLSFTNEPLAMIIPRLERWYGREVAYDPGMAADYRFTFKVTDESLERILTMMGRSAGIKYERDGDRFRLIMK